MPTPIIPSNEDAATSGADLALLQRLKDIVQSARHADQQAQGLIERIDALHERAAVVQHSSLEHLLDQLGSLEGHLADRLDREQEQSHDTEQVARRTSEHAKSETFLSIDALEAQVDKLDKTITAEVQSTSAFLSNRIESQVEHFAQQSRVRLDDLLSKTQAAWSHARDDVQDAVDDVLQKTGQSLSEAQSGSLKSAEDTLHRIAQLKADVDSSARVLSELIGTFSELMGGTRIGLNVTAGTVNDLVSIFEDIA